MMAKNPKKYGHIVVEGLKVFAYHGVDPQETLVGNTFEVSLRLVFPADAAMRRDRLDLSINYADVVFLIKKEMEQPSKLLENVVYRIYHKLWLSYPQIVGGKIEVYKLCPPIGLELDRVGFVYEW